MKNALNYTCFLEASPLLILFQSLLSFLLFGFGFRDKGMGEEHWPVLALARVLVEKTLQEILEIGRHVVRIFDGILNDQVDETIDGIRVERRLSNEQFVQDDSQRPEIHCVIVRLFFHEFGCHVQRRSLDRSEHLRIG